MKSTILKQSSYKKSLLSLSKTKREKFIQSLTEAECNVLFYDWEIWARQGQQLPPGIDWFTWLLLSGRGYGKTRTGAETVRMWAKDFSPIALIGQTKADVRDTMIELGESSILQISEPGFRPVYESSKRRLVWPNGAIGIIYSGDEPDQFRGPQHAKAWVDELAKFQYPTESWDNLELGLRIGAAPQVIVTTTPRPIKVIKDIVADPRTVLTTGSTFENKANLAPMFLDRMKKKYKGTRLGEQELEGKILIDNPGALWNIGLIDKSRIHNLIKIKAATEKDKDVMIDFVRVVAGVDPEATSSEGSAETGIIVAGLDAEGHGYILSDRSLRATPNQWAAQVITAYHAHSADRVIAEINNGGEMVETIIRSIDKQVSYKGIHASHGKLTRAEPVAALYEQGRIHHVGSFPELEDQMTSWVPGEKSPDRMDALVWAITELMLGDSEEQRIRLL